MVSNDISQKQYNLLKIPLLAINGILITYFAVLVAIGSIYFDDNYLILDLANDSNVFSSTILNKNSSHLFRLYCIPTDGNHTAVIYY